MRGTSRRLLFLLCGLAAVALGGCADLDFLPVWFPFQGPISDKLPGVKTPAERIAELQKLADTAASHSEEEKQKISEELAVSMRNEQDPLIRVQIIRTLGCYPGSAADAILKAALSDTETNVRLAACEGWSHRNDANAVALLSETLKGDVKGDVRLAAARALGETHHPAAVPALGEALSDPDPAMQYRAVLSLEMVTGKDLGRNVERWQEYVKNPPKGDKTPTMAEQMRSLF
ncbi:MAG: HEAT repeat domain-containing protein [Thermoguttaceae bacterium]